MVDSHSENDPLIVDLPIKSCDVSIVMLVYQMVTMV